jgi:uncharacterized protein (DUF58 family)
MERSEILRRISTFPIAAGKLSKGLLLGGFRSVFQGQGIEFNEVRLYQSGDDVRYIDKNVSARFGKPYIKMYREEREIPVFVLLDCSASMFAASSAVISRFEQAVFAAALLGFSAEKTNQRFGAIFFDKHNTKIFPPVAGRAHVMAIISSALGSTPKENGTGLYNAISAANTVAKRKSFVVLISDFLSIGWEREMGLLAKKHDCLAIRIIDPLDTELSGKGVFHIRDPESGARVLLHTKCASQKIAWAKWTTDRERVWSATCARYGSASLELSTNEDAAKVLTNYFQSTQGTLP